jgi:hypothetical protein
MSPILAILIVWLVGIPAMYCLVARFVSLAAERQARRARAALQRGGHRLIVVGSARPANVRRFARSSHGPLG